ncbi:hypothetical protein [Haloferula sp. BvORR071]|uniref:hypothetical protein n=1 Tax=Haloferula sp. BvORR071 TaxID=1396141 RepID=UPI000695CF65|nr:hypothetical protein [Haloferula sp. BvORR071]
MNLKRINPWLAFGVLLAVLLLAGSLRDPDFWSTPDQRGDALLRKKRYADAAKTYADPWRIGIAQYRDSQFEAAAKTFGRVPGATGAYNAANSWLMHGAYDAAIAGYDKALGFRPGWQEALDNKQLAITRRDRMGVSDKEREQESAEAYKPDEIVFDQKGKGDPGKEKPPIQGPADDASLQATWLRRVKTTPADFLKAKFAWQAAKGGQP